MQGLAVQPESFVVCLGQFVPGEPEESRVVDPVQLVAHNRVSQAAQCGTDLV